MLPKLSVVKDQIFEISNPLQTFVNYSKNLKSNFKKRNIKYKPSNFVLLITTDMKDCVELLLKFINIYSQFLHVPCCRRVTNYSHLQVEKNYPNHTNAQTQDTYTSQKHTHTNTSDKVQLNFYYLKK